MTDTEGPFPHRETGFALVLSLLFTGIVLLIVVSTAASLVTGSRQGGANERVAYQALLVSESGLNTLPRRAAEYIRTKPYTGTTQSDLQTWLTGSSSPANVGGLRAELNASTARPAASGNTITALTARSATTFTVESRGTSGSGTKTTLQDFAVNDRTLPPGVRPNSGVIAVPRIMASGSSSIRPVAMAGVTTTSSTVTVGTTRTTLAVNSVAALRSGDYITAGGATLRIDAVTAGTNTLTVTKVLPSGGAGVTISSRSDVNLLPNAVSQTAAPVATSMTVSVTNVTDFRPGEPVSMKIGSTVYAGTVQTINAATKTATITWSTSPLPTSIPEGTPIGRNMLAMSSAGTVGIDPQASTKLGNFQGISQGTVTNDCTATNACAGSGTVSRTVTPSQFTQALFGLTDAELNDLVPLTTTTPAFASSRSRDINVGILRISAAMYNQIIDSNKTYTGVIIIEDAVTQNLTGTTVNGLLYLRGGMNGTGGNAPKFTGSMVVNGSIAVYGSPNDTTSVLSGNVAVNYNAVQLRVNLGSVTGSKRLDAVSGTWRQQ